MKVVEVVVGVSAASSRATGLALVASIQIARSGRTETGEYRTFFVGRAGAHTDRIDDGGVRQRQRDAAIICNANCICLIPCNGATVTACGGVGE